MSDHIFRPPSVDMKYLRSGGLFFDTDYGRIRVWYNEDGMYVDMYNPKKGDMCLMSMHPESDGISAYIYGDHKSGSPTKSEMFNDLKNIFDDRNFEFDLGMYEERYLK